MSEAVKFTKNTDSLLAVARRRRDDDDYVGAASAYRSILSDEPENYSVNAELAELLCDIELYDEAANRWFVCLSVAENADQRARALNGLGAAHYFSGRDMLAVHYFSEQLMSMSAEEYLYDELIDEVRELALEEEAEQKNPRFKVVHNVNALKESAKQISLAQKLFEDGKFNEALVLLAGVSEDSPDYIRSLELMSFILLLQNKIKQAMDVSLYVLEVKKDSFTAHYVLAGGYKSLGDDGKCNEHLSAAEGLVGDDQDRQLRMVTLALELEDENKALFYINKVLLQNFSNMNLKYVRGIINYNLGNVKDALRDFSDVVTLTDNVLAKEKLKKAGLLEGHRPERLEYSFELENEKIAERQGELLENVAERDGVSGIDISDVISQCEAVVFSRISALVPMCIHLALAVDAVKGMTYFDGVLMDCRVPDNIKAIILKEYLLTGVEMPVKCVTAHLYKQFTLKPKLVTEEPIELLSQVYAEVAANLYMIDPDKVSVLDKKADALFDAYRQNGGGNEDVAALAAAVTYLLKIPMLSTRKMSRTLFDVSDEQLNKAIKLFERNE